MKKLNLIIICIILIATRNLEIKSQSTTQYPKPQCADSLLEVVWSMPVKHFIEQPLVIKNLIFPSFDSPFAVNAETQEKLPFGNPEAIKKFNRLQLDSFICYPKHDKFLIYNIYTGELVNDRFRGDFEGVPYFTDRIVFAEDKGLSLAYDIQKKKVLWQVERENNDCIRRSFIYKDLIVIPDERLLFVNKHSGQITKSIDIRVLSNFIYHNNFLYCSVGFPHENLLKINLKTYNTIELFKYKVDIGKIVKDNDYLYFQDNELCRFDLENEIQTCANDGKGKEVGYGSHNRLMFINDYLIDASDVAHGYFLMYIYNPETLNMEYCGFNNEQSGKLILFSEALTSNGLLIGLCDQKLFAFRFKK